MCLGQFSKADLEDSSPNMLTLEHAPPESVGGQGIALTCKRCNSIAGHDVDFHLGERLREVESRSFLPNTTIRVRATNNGLTVQATINVEADGTLKMTHSKSNNNPTKVEAFAEAVNPIDNPMVEIEFQKSKTTFRGFEIGLLKTAYILAFAKFGYSFILDGVYNIIRAQLNQPDLDLYPEHFWLKDLPEFRQYGGVHLCNTPIAECFLSVFQLNPSQRAYYYGVCLPLPLASIDVAINTLYAMRDGGEVSFDRTDTTVDYLFDVKAIQDIKAWFERVRWSKLTLLDARNVPTAMKYLQHPVQLKEMRWPVKNFFPYVLSARWLNKRLRYKSVSRLRAPEWI
jgi:hypothetical protein